MTSNKQVEPHIAFQCCQRAVRIHAARVSYPEGVSLESQICRFTEDEVSNFASKPLTREVFRCFLFQIHPITSHSGSVMPDQKKEYHLSLIINHIP